MVSTSKRNLSSPEEANRSDIAEHDEDQPLAKRVRLERSDAGGRDGEAASSLKGTTKIKKEDDDDEEEEEEEEDEEEEDDEGEEGDNDKKSGKVKKEDEDGEDEEDEEDEEKDAEEEEEEEEEEEDKSAIVKFEFDGVEYTYKERPAVIEEREGKIEFRVVNNDNSRESMMILTGLKNIFQKQLPKMPREYIARLVYDRSHISIAVVRKPLTVVGGITYKPFNSRKFAEIVFCAISSTEQVRGYGAHLMNHLKDYVKATSPIMHFLTYADNYAIGYFKKQGFTKEITLEKSVWMGYIKDYEGGTIMQCTMLPRIRYLDSNKILLLQKAAIMRKIRAMSKSHIVNPGLEAFRNGADRIDPMEIPGIKESGWTPEMDELARRPKRGPHYAAMKHLLNELQKHPSSWPFLQPVNKDEVSDYYEVIKEPMDLSTMEQRLEEDAYQSMEDFIHDAKLIYDNCRSYNNENTTYYKNATKLEKFMYAKLKEMPEYAALAE